jgi:hypothetical protein
LAQKTRRSAIPRLKIACVHDTLSLGGSDSFRQKLELGSGSIRKARRGGTEPRRELEARTQK